MKSHHSPKTLAFISRPAPTNRSTGGGGRGVHGHVRGLDDERGEGKGTDSPVDSPALRPAGEGAAPLPIRGSGRGGGPSAAAAAAAAIRAAHKAQALDDDFGFRMSLGGTPGERQTYF